MGRTTRIDAFIHDNRSRLGGQAGQFRNIGDLKFPDIHMWVSDPFGRLAIALLEKSPLTLSEVLARTRLSVDDLLRALEANAAEFGPHISLHSMLENRRHSLAELASRERPDFSFSAIGFTGRQGAEALARHASQLCSQRESRPV